ncbi:MAG: outer membrane protein insertion porin family [Clostridiales bacterium]|jgi:outer membrane protein insertion porin family|nr:outer membrane protein insertion porin family [Clostridiales bacterium]MDN5281141.1 outer membrane protein insertion porin family [Candidatus Ozemobacter sp.]
MNRTNLFYIITAFILLAFTIPGAFAYESNVVVGFEVEGNRLIEENVILLNLAMKEGDIVSPEAVQEEISRLGEMGYFSYVGAEIRAKGQGKVVVFKVEENAIIGDIEIKGCSKIKNEVLKAAMESKIGSVFNSKLLTQDIQHLNEALAREGYLFSKVSDAYVQDQGSKINIEITEGVISEVRIEGLKKTKEKVVRRELSVKAGEIYDNKKIVRDLQRIYNLGFFEEVKRDHLPGKTPEEIVLVIQVVEQKTGRAGVGAGYSSLNGLVGFVNLSQNNFQGEGKRVYMKTEFGGVQTYELGYFDPWLNNRPQSFGIDVYNTKYTRNLYDSGNTLTEYDERRKGGAITLGRRIRRDVDLSFRFRDEDVKLTPTDSTATAPAGIFNGRLQTFAAILDKDTRDNRFRPTRGLHDSFWVETTGGLLKGPNQYTKYMLALRRYFAISQNRKTVVAIQGVGGQTEIGEGFVPIYDMFSVGGSDTVRGYEEREFLGTKVFYANLELRQNFAKNFDAVLFYDVGSAWGTDYDRKKQDFDLKQGYGIGIRLQTPLGPVALDYGKATDRGDGTTYINFGSSF